MKRTYRPITAGRRGFTLVELLVVITIIGILISLLMPAVQSAREAARKNTCANWLSQYGKAAANHESSNGFFPTGGWGTSWVGDPDRGFTLKQPGGWIFNLLPYMDGSPLHDMGAGQAAGTKTGLLGTMIATSQPYYNCPSRRRNTTYPSSANYNNATVSASPAMVSRSDYAANVGDNPIFSVGAGPSSTSAGDSGYNWPTDTAVNGSGMTGICYLRSQVTQAAITDGSSNTYLAGERYLDPNHYEDGLDPADTLCALAGWSNDLYRDCQGGKSPWQDNLNGLSSTAASNATTTAFGSAHPGALNMVFCDGSVHSISYSIDQETNRRLANRADNLPVDASKYGP